MREASHCGPSHEGRLTNYGSAAASIPFALPANSLTPPKCAIILEWISDLSLFPGDFMGLSDSLSLFLHGLILDYVLRSSSDLKNKRPDSTLEALLVRSR